MVAGVVHCVPHVHTDVFNHVGEPRYSPWDVAVTVDPEGSPPQRRRYAADAASLCMMAGDPDGRSFRFGAPPACCDPRPTSKLINGDFKEPFAALLAVLAAARVAIEGSPPQRRRYASGAWHPHRFTY